MSVAMIVEPLALTENLLEFIQQHFLSRFPHEDLELLKRKRSFAFAEKHFAIILHPIGKPYTEYALHVAKFLLELGADSVLVSAAVICLSPSITKQIVEDIKNTFKNEPE